ncbi:hypothetical protein [Streptosporangium sp. KLBMP 9127]|nr:hypothetical protein [Streptosporangium sp. KLBMP 9127]
METVETYWEHRLPAPAGNACVIVEVLHQDIRVALRNLTVANAIRRVVPARLVVVTGTDRQWSEALWQEFDVDCVRSLARAFGASEVVNVHEAATRWTGGLTRPFPPSGVPPIDPGTLDAFVNATVCRLDLVPRLAPGYENDPGYRSRHRRGSAFSAVYDEVFDGVDPVALVTSHVDYDQWGLAVESAMRRDVPVVHVQSTGSLKAYALFPHKRVGGLSYRAELTKQIGEYFDRVIWPNRDLIRPAAELVALRAKENLGRPSWWRAGAFVASEVRNEVERGQVRAHGLARLGLDPARPVVTVFNHAISDALGSNHEIFDDLAHWFESTARHAADDTSASWVFLDHPSQFRYDSTGFFPAIAERYSHLPHLVFGQSVSISKNMLWSITDVGVTVRGSVSNELPAYGIPVIQAGWSEWSSCGLSFVAENRESYWNLLDEAIAKAAKGGTILEEEQRERARLWLWLYRSAADVTTPLVPQWEVGAGDDLLRALFVNMSHIESDGDPLFAAVERLWTRRDPFLTRFDLLSPEALR